MIKTERWLTHYYENLRQMHMFVKRIYNSYDYGEAPHDFKKRIEEINGKLYKAEEIAMREYGK